MSFSQTFTWKPKTKARPQFVKGTGRTYTEPATVAAEKAIAEQYTGPKFEGPVAVTFNLWNDRVVMEIVECEDYTQRKLTGDTDNYLKLLSDGLNGIAFVDDKQIVTVLGHKN